MAKGKYEVEIKSLLGTKDNADELYARMCALDPACALVSDKKQLNHYFEGGDIRVLAETMRPYISESANELMKEICEHGSGLSIRSREIDGVVRFVVKASVGSDSSDNGVLRKEIEEVIPGKTLDELDEIILGSGYKYQAKWSRERKEYTMKDATVCLDKNAGYGYLAEFEKVIEDESELAKAKEDLLALMSTLGVEELAQDRLERMFAHYNAHWPEFYGTDNVFTIE